MLGIIIVGVILLAGASRLVLQPADPRGCVSVLSCQLGWLIIPLCAGLAFLLAALLCYLSRGQLEELSVFGVALGLSLAALRYENASHLWVSVGQGIDSNRRALALVFTLESVGWILVILAAHLGARVTIKKLQLKPIISSEPASEYRRGGLVVLFMSLAAMFLLQITSAGTELAPIQTGQVYFACAISFYAAAWMAYTLTGARSPIWAYFAVGAVAIIGYTWTIYHATPSHPGLAISHLAHFSPTTFGRALPIHMVMIGTTGAIFGNWHQRQLTRYAAPSEANED